MTVLVQERRRYPRLTNNVPLKLSSENADVVTETRNLSCNGAYCRVNKYLEPMTRLKIQLLLPFKSKSKVTTKKVACQGVVIRTQSIPGEQYFDVAIFFNDIQQKDLNCLNDYINSLLDSGNMN